MFLTQMRIGTTGTITNLRQDHAPFVLEKLPGTRWQPPFPKTYSPSLSTDIRVEPVDNADDFAQFYRCMSAAFGEQVKSSLWMMMNPNWDTAEGQKQGALRYLKRWQSITNTKDGHPNTVMLKATLRDPQDGFRIKIVGAAVWTQFSFVEGCGIPPTDRHPDIPILEPDEGRFATQIYRSLWRRRVSFAREKAASDSPVMFTLDICAVHPDFQRLGIGKKLTAWGIEEAKRRGGLECTTEASLMGRAVYQRLGFTAEGEEKNILIELDEEFKHRDKPQTMFMRTWAGQHHQH